MDWVFEISKFFLFLGFDDLFIDFILFGAYFASLGSFFCFCLFKPHSFCGSISLHNRGTRGGLGRTSGASEAQDGGFCFERSEERKLDWVERGSGLTRRHATRGER